jgi:uncharacterized tellurite resistance protein B-like protein
MIGRLQAYFRERLAPASDQDAAHRRHLAAAALLVEIARADFDYSGDEHEAIRAALEYALDLDASEVSELVELARGEAEEAISLHQFTRLINDSHSIDDKRALMVDLWRVAHADGRVDHFEEHLLRRIADLLHLRHSEFMQAKHAAGAAG